MPKFSIAIIVGIFAFSFFGSYIYDLNPYTLNSNEILLKPSFEHLMGTDRLGRDILARVIEGGKISLIIGVGSAFIASLIGLILGSLAGYLRGSVDKAFVVTVDLFLTFPTFFLLLALVSYVNASAWVLIVIISVTGWMTTARLIRSESFKITSQPYIKILNIAKVSKIKILFKYYAPILAPIYFVSFTFGVGGAILAESGLSFLGLGIVAPQMSWGTILSGGKDVIEIAWWVSFFPGLMIFLVTFALINISNYLQQLTNKKTDTGLGDIMENHKIGYSFLVMASVVIVLAGIKSASEIVIPFLLSLFLAIILSPLYNFFRKKGLADSLSLALVIGIFSLFLVIVANMLGSSTQDFSSNIDFYQSQLLSYFKEIDTLASAYGIELPINELSSTINSKQIMLFTTDILQSMGSMFANGFVVLFTLIFMLLESNHFMEKIAYIKGSQGNVERIKEISQKIKHYVVLKAAVSFLTGLLIWIALLLIGTDYAFLWAFLAFLLNFIPNIGSIIAALPAVLLTLVQLGTLSASLVAFVYLAVNVVIGSVIEPKVMGRGLGLSTLVVFLSLLFWGWLLGSVGMLLSVPLTIMVKIAFDANEKTKWIAVLLGSGENLPKKDNK